VKQLALVVGLLLLPASVAPEGCALGTAAISAILDCTAKDLSGLGAVAEALVGRLASAPDATWSAVTTDLEKAGETIGTCVASDLLDIAEGSNGSGTAAEAYTDAVDVSKCREMLTAVKGHFKITARVKTAAGVR
jgi:hypothetical protein